MTDGLRAVVRVDPRLRPIEGLERMLGGLGAGLAPALPALPDDGVPRVLLVPEGGQAPPGSTEHAVEVPDGIDPRSLAVLLRLAVEGAALRAEAAGHQRRLGELNRIGIALSAERDFDRLRELILRSCRELTSADGASLWLVEGAGDERVVRLVSAQSHSLHLALSSFTVPLAPTSQVGYTIISEARQVVDDVYAAGTPYGFEGARAFDERHRYRTRSILCVPMRTHAGDVVGAVQLVNAKRSADTRLTLDNVEAEVRPFSREDASMVESIASQAAVAIDNRRLVDSIQDLFQGFVQASVTAIESRDPATHGHSGRVAALTVRLAERVTAHGAGPYRDLRFDHDQLRELRYAALLHDFGKVGVREQVLVKEKKLYPAQLERIGARFDLARRSRQLARTEEKLRLACAGTAGAAALAEVDRVLAGELAELGAWLEAVRAAAEPSILDERAAATLAIVAARTYEGPDGGAHPLLDPEEVRLLSIGPGTLDERERMEIESHVTHSFRFLSKIPWTSGMRGVPEIAFGHHEKLDGSGYPRRLRGEAIPVQARMMTIADIYDALTASDRPYRRAASHEAALRILGAEAEAGKLDAGLLDVFVRESVHEAAAEYRPDRDLLLGGHPR